MSRAFLASYLTSFSFLSVIHRRGGYSARFLRLPHLRGSHKLTPRFRAELPFTKLCLQKPLGKRLRPTLRPSSSLASWPPIRQAYVN